LNYFLSITRQAYQEFAERVETANSRSGKGEIVRQIIEHQVGPFTLSELKAQCPSVSVQLIKKVLAQMRNEGLVQLAGRGRGARWERTPD
jgi:DNA-binding HxlR family transcriptional regulator